MPKETYRSMVFIKKVEIRGFKSFGGSASISFDQGFVAITGPNGSGKSNIFDAIIFALGESRAKALRVNKLTSIICDAGPQGKETSAKVVVHIDNSGRRIPMDSDSVSVTRELKETGENLYYLNGRRTTRNVLTEILSVAFMAPGGLNIVPQGMVTRTSDLLPDEKRKLVEEVIGISQFDHKKVQAMEQLREADIKLQVAVAKMDEIKRRVRDLEAERNDQIRLKHLEDGLRWLRAVKLSGSLLNLTKRIGATTRDKELKEEALLNVRTKFEELEKELSREEEERRKFVVSVIDGAGARQAEVQYKIAKFSNEIQILEALSREALETISRLEEEIPRLKDEREQGAIGISDVKAEIKNKESFVSQLEREVKEKARLQKAISKKKAKLEKDHSLVIARLEALRKRVEALNESWNTNSSRMESLKGRHEIAAERLKSLSDKATAFRDLLIRLEEMTKELLQHREVEEQSLKGLHRSMNEIANKRRTFEEELSRAVGIRDKVTQEVSTYELKRSVAELMDAPELTLRKVMELADEGVLDGIIGPLGELISCDPEYEQALLASAKRWTNALVVDDLKSMLKLAEVTKRLKLGRLIVIPLSEVEDIQASPAPGITGVIGNLVNLVRFDPSLKGVVNFALGDTIVVSSLGVAYELSAQGFRCTTVSGDVFEPKGPSMETGRLVLDSEIRKEILDSESLSPVKEAISSLGKIISSRKKALDELLEKSSQLGRERLSKTLTIERLKGEFSSVKSFLVRHKRLSRYIQREINEVTKEEASLRLRIEKLDKAQGSIRQRIEALNKKTEDLKASSSAVQNFVDLEEERAKLGGTIEELNNKVRDGVTTLAKRNALLDLTLIPNLQMLEERIEGSEALLTERKAFLDNTDPRIEVLRKELDVHRKEEKEILETAKMSRQTLETKESRIGVLKSKGESVRASIGSLEKDLLNYERTHESLRDQEQKILSELSLYGYSEPLEPFHEADAMLEEMNREYGELRTRVNLLADTTYRSIFDGYKNLSVRRNDLEKDRDAIVKFVESIDAEKRKVFMAAFEKIDRELRNIFRSITGGSAWLELEDPDDIFGSGIFLMTEFPGKVAREASGVSGGEKSVSALSFILSLQSVFPSPFYLFDEIDAHLDPVNSERLADLLRVRSKNSQIVTITLKDTMVSRADLVCGIYMNNGISEAIRYRPRLEVQVKGG